MPESPLPSASFKPPHEERMHGLDNLRAAAMLLGVVLHAALSFITVPVPWIAHDKTAAPGFDLLVGIIHGFRMPLFFFLAGFFGHLLWRRLGARQFLKQRGIRIGLPLVLGMVTIVPLVIAVSQWADTRTATDPAWHRRGPLTLSSIPTCHLWFLEMLLLLYALAALAALAGKRLKLSAWLPRLDSAFDWLVTSNWKPLLLTPLTLCCMWGGPMLGETDDAGMRLLPAGRAVAFYGVFFFVGWWMHRRRHRLDALHSRLKSQFAFAAMAFMTFGSCRLSGAGPADPHFLMIKLLALTAASLYAWLMTFAVTGWFLRFAGQNRPWVRYLADASYWFYFLHLPLVLWLQVIVSLWPLPGTLKFAFIMTATLGVLLASYHWCVRPTRLGQLLFSRRPRPSS